MVALSALEGWTKVLLDPIGEAAAEHLAATRPATPRASLDNMVAEMGVLCACKLSDKVLGETATAFT
jgi:hypothetical protein